MFPFQSLDEVLEGFGTRRLYLLGAGTPIDVRTQPWDDVALGRWLRRVLERDVHVRVPSFGGACDGQTAWPFFAMARLDGVDRALLFQRFATGELREGDRKFVELRVEGRDVDPVVVTHAEGARPDWSDLAD